MYLGDLTPPSLRYMSTRRWNRFLFTLLMMTALTALQLAKRWRKVKRRNRAHTTLGEREGGKGEVRRRDGHYDVYMCRQE